MLLATDENTLFELVPTSLTVPITITRITASITAYSAMSLTFFVHPQAVQKLGHKTSGGLTGTDRP
jgi:hypothetical protein